MIERKATISQDVTERFWLTALDVTEGFWLTALDVLRNNAAQASSNILLAALKQLLKNISAFLIIGLTVYAIGGWSGLATLAKVLLGRVE